MTQIEYNQKQIFITMLFFDNLKGLTDSEKMMLFVKVGLAEWYSDNYRKELAQ